MTAQEIEEFMKKWGLSATEAAFTLGISHSSLHQAKAGKRLSDDTRDLMLKKKAKYERAKSRASTDAA
jgi:hypothetical protein